MRTSAYTCNCKSASLYIKYNIYSSENQRNLRQSPFLCYLTIHAFFMLIAIESCFRVENQNEICTIIMKKSAVIFSLAVALLLAGILHFTNFTNIPNTASDLKKPVLRIGAIGFYDPQDAFDLFFVTDFLTENYQVKYVTKNYDLLLTGPLVKPKDIPQDPDIIKIYYTGEVFKGDAKQHLNTHDLVLAFDYIKDHPNYVRLPFSYVWHRERLSRNYSADRGECEPSTKKYFACFLVTNGGYWHEAFDGARDRNMLFHRLSLYKFVASGGKFLNTMQEVLPREADNEEWLAQCKFVIAYENQYYPGYITEKTVSGMVCGGCSDI